MHEHDEGVKKIYYSKSSGEHLPVLQTVDDVSNLVHVCELVGERHSYTNKEGK